MDVGDLDAFRSAVRAFIREHAPEVRRRQGVRAPEPDEVPDLTRWTAQLYDAGYLGADWPEEWGGDPAYDPQRYAVFLEEMARAEAPRPIGTGTLAASALIEFGSDEQRRRHLPGIRRGEHIWCQLFSEPNAGSDLASLQTRARADGDEFVVDGQKVWTTNAHFAHYGYLLARTDPDAEKHAGITAFILDMRSPGVEVRPLREITGTSDFNEVFFDGVRVPRENVIGELEQGWTVATKSLMHERFGVGTAGIELQKTLADVVDLVLRTRTDGAPSAARHDVRQAVGRFVAEVEVCRLLGSQAVSNSLAGRSGPGDAPSSKVFFTELNLALAEFGVRVQGADGILTEGDDGAVDRGRWQDAYLYARGFTISGGSNEIMRNLIAERDLGLPRK